jgi:hypothetical protein
MNSAAKPPNFLYKYSAFSALSLENLKNQIIYFGSPRSFNDPYDCSVTPAIRIPSDIEISRTRDRYLASPLITSAARDELHRATIEQMRQLFLRSAAQAATEKVNEFSEKRGVSCFSESRDDLLMWAHYGGTYRGYCLGFNTTYLPKIQQVKYSDNMPSFDPMPILNGELEINDFMSVFATKSRPWAYEKEWRIFHDKVGTSYSYDVKALTGIYFGPEISQAALEIICLILQGQNDTVKFFKGTRNASQFKIEFEPFHYLPYLQAKKSGFSI